MKKISTLFKKDPNDLGRVINEVDPQNQWVIDGMAIATRKWDGSACAIINSELYKRYDAKKGKTAPEGAIPCQEPDPITGHHPHWVKCDRSKKEDQYFFEGWDALNEEERVDGTYELLGEKVQGNPEGVVKGHILMKHDIWEIPLWGYDFEYLRDALSLMDYEGIVFYHLIDDRMCKLRKSDFGLKR
jgi:hypothetical protein